MRISDWSSDVCSSDLVSESIARFLIVTLQHHHNLQLRYEIASFTHNRAGTNVFAFVASHADWFPIQRKTTGNDEPPSRKIELVDAGAVEIYDLLAIESLSPSVQPISNPLRDKDKPKITKFIVAAAGDR